MMTSKSWALCHLELALDRDPKVSELHFDSQQEASKTMLALGKMGSDTFSNGIQFFVFVLIWSEQSFLSCSAHLATNTHC